MIVQEFLKKCKNAYAEADFTLIQYALDYATKWHEGQFRVSGEPYIHHPIGAALTLVELGMDVPSVCAALLHDVIEDTACEGADLKKKFGEEIYNLVEAVTKLSKLKYKFNSREEEQAENLRKLFFAISKDLRVLFIKLADRLHNMRTLDSLPAEKQKRIAQETLDIYAPMSARLGISQIKSDLEDLSMKYLYPDAYRYLAGELDQKRQERMKYVQRIAGEIQMELDKVGINADIKGRPKHFYSIYKKMVNQNKTLEQIYDLIAVRVIVSDIKECYSVLGIIHSMWKPVPGRFKDYIAMPKPNLYQSLHTTVVSNFGQIFEIQIRTYEMNRIAEFGIAAHWKYKEGRTTKDSDLDKKLSWVREVMESEEDINDSKEYLFTFKNSIVLNEIYVFSPKGEVFDLPTDSTPVDFAYKVHSQVGNKCIGAKVNNKMVPLNTTLVTGDVVEIITSNAGKGPSRDWLKFVVSSQAKAKIRAFFKKERAGENIKLGKDMLEREAKRKGFDWNLLAAQDEDVKELIARYSLSSLDDLYASIGYGALKTGQVLLKLIDRYKKTKALEQKLEIINNAQTQPQPEAQKPTKTKSASGVSVAGYDDFMVKLARCCSPVPGDEIVGYAMRGAGVSVHRKDCPNIKTMEKERFLPVSWTNSDNSVFLARLQIECVDKTGLAMVILPTISNQGIYMTSVDMRVQKGIAIIHISLQVKSAEELDFIIKKIENLPETISIKRA